MHSPAEAPEAYARYLTEYVDALKSFEPHILTRAVDAVRGEWSGLTWPPPGRIAQAACAAEREDRATRPDTPAIPYYKPAPEAVRAGRLSVGEKMGRLKKLIAGGEFGTMSHEEAYDEVYAAEAKPGHKADMMDRLYKREGAA